ncbi:unnamed protein product, partial [Phaeothamnion confervicola]
ITLTALQERFHQPLRLAAEGLNISVARLLKVCRSFAILRWPYRQVRSLREALAEVRKDMSVAAAAGQSATALQQLQRLFDLYLRKEELVVLFASRGLEAPVRELFFAWDVREMDRALVAA